MAWARTSCPRCGEVEFLIRGITLFVQQPPTDSYYSFICPIHKELVKKPANDGLVTQLRAIGAKVVDKCSHPEPHDDSAAPITSDDIVDTQKLLVDDERFVSEISKLAAK